MVRALPQLPLGMIVNTIVSILLNKFDCFIIIEGGTGIGKSTLALHLAKKVRLVFYKLKKLDPETVEYFYNKVKLGKGESVEEFVTYLMGLDKEKGYNFTPYRDLIYSQDNMKEFLSSWNRIGIPDEMINITFNRDFYSEAQKDIIKMINMYRDHLNLIIACVPQFQTLDNQIKNLCKIKISVVRRGIGIFQTPNKTIYGRDKWDQITNEKIEREWISKGSKNPRYSRLTTARGIVRFSKLTPSEEKKYQDIKNKKRSQLLKAKDEVKTEDNIDKAVKMLVNGGVKDGEILKGFALAEGITYETLKKRIKKKLEEQGKDTRINKHFSKVKEMGDGVF